MAHIRSRRPLLLTALLLCCSAIVAEADRLHGTVLLREDDGATRRPDFGKLAIWVRQHGEWTKLEAELVEGAFELEIAAGASWIDLGPLELEGREAYAAWSQIDEVPAAPIELVARWTRPVSLRVVSASDGAELTGIALVADDDAFYPGGGSAGEHMGESLSSPISLPLWRDDDFGKGFVGRRAYWARAPGYAWKRIEVDAASAAENVLRLEPEAHVLIELASQLPEDVWVFLAHPRQRFQSVRVPFQWSAESEHVVESLAPGEYRVFAEITTDFGAPTGQLLFDRRIQLAAGEVEQVLIELADRSQAFDEHGALLAGSTPMRGTLRIPLGWKVEHLALHFQRYEPVDAAYQPALGLRPIALVERPEEPGLYDWDAGLVRPGAWLAVLAPIPWSAAFPVEGPGPFAIELELPPPADVRVRIVDAASKQDVHATLRWYALPPPTRSGISGVDVARDDPTATWSFQAPVGEIVLMPIHADYPMRFDRVAIATGMNELVLELQKPRRVRVTVLEGDRALHMHECTPRFTTIDGEGKVVERSWVQQQGAPTHSIWMLDAPGRYRVDIEPSGTFELLEAVEVDLREADLAEIELRVRRRQ